MAKTVLFVDPLIALTYPDRLTQPAPLSFDVDGVVAADAVDLRVAGRVEAGADRR